VTVGIRALVDVRQFELSRNQGVDVVDVVENVRGSGAGVFGKHNGRCEWV
jgi:hypothetical protein